MTNPGGFQNLQFTGRGVYWTGTTPPGNPTAAWTCIFFQNAQAGYGKTEKNLVMAVRAGDVAAVPEPETYALTLAGLAALALARRQRRS